MVIKLNNHHDIDVMFGFTAMAGVFPNAGNINAFWEKILRAEVAPLTNMEDKWKVDRNIYFDPKPGKSGYVYLDHAFCLPGVSGLRGPQIAYAGVVIRELLKNLKESNNLPNLSRTGLVLAVNWGDEAYYLSDLNILLNKKRISDNFRMNIRYSPDERLNDIARSAGIAGPCLTIDTACATSSYGIVAAKHLILSNQADAVVILGLNVTIPLYLMLPLSQIVALSLSGQSLPFSKDASGMVPGESAAAVLLEPVHQALQSGRKIYGVLRAVGLSADGMEGSVFSPGFEGQMLSYKRAYTEIDPSSIDYIEAHGTATTMGDKIELNSLNTFFGDFIKKDKKLPVGSVKALVGHTIAASSMVSLIKVLLMIQNRTIPPHVRVDPSSGFEGSCLCLTKEPADIEEKEHPIRIGLSSFGLGGSNSHMIVESYEPDVKTFYFHQNRATEPDLPQMAIVDMEVAFGDTISADAWRQHVTSGQYGFQHFPFNRFESEFNTTLKGLFLPEKIKIDALNLRMGPKLIPLVDSFQNLGTYLISKILNRHPALKNSNDTGVSLCCNSGGGMQFRMARRAHGWHYAVLNRILPPDDQYRPCAAIEEIYSMLGSMFSGFPSYHYNMKAFHQTFSGRADLFWTTFQAAPILLSKHCRQLLLGGGSYIKTPIDFYYPGLQDNIGSTHIVEGIGIFYAKSLIQAEADNDRILAVIKAMVPGSQADNFIAACSVANIDPMDVDIHETCQLMPGGNLMLNETRDETSDWFLYEATGIDKLAAVLLKDGNLGAIQVYSGDRLDWVVFIEKRKQFKHSPEPLKFPLEISFVDKTVSEIFQ